MTSSSSRTHSNAHVPASPNGRSPASSSGFFERFGRNRPRTSSNLGAQSYQAIGGEGASEEPESSYNGRARSSSVLRAGMSRISTSSFAQSQDNLGRYGATSRSSNNLRSPYEESAPPLARQDSGHGGMAPMVRTNSSGNGPNGNGPLGRLFRRYSQGLGARNDSSSNLHGSSNSEHQDSSSHRALDGIITTVEPEPRPLGLSAISLENNLLGPHAAAADPVPVHAAAMTTSTTPAAASAPSTQGTNPSPQAGIHRIRLVPHLEAIRSLHFEPIERDVREGSASVKVGRFTDRTPAAPSTTDPGAGSALTAAIQASLSSGPTGSAPGNRGGAVPSSAGGGGRIDSSRIAFKSKVVSRGHAEIWCEAGGKFFIKDTKSSSGTFLNHIRLSAPNVASKPFPIKDGDILQLGVDYQGGTEEIYRCVKIRVELNRGWQREANQFNVNALRQLRALQGTPMPATTASASSDAALPTNRQSMNVTDCCICLFSVTVCQALFIAPCSHVFHYKCIRPLLNTHHPGFSCPLCRTFADLEADVEQDEAWQENLLKEAGFANDTQAVQADVSTPITEAANPLAVVLPSPALSQAEAGNASPVVTSIASAGAPSSPVSSRRTASGAPSGLRQQVFSGNESFHDRPPTAVDDPDTTALLTGNAILGASPEAVEENAGTQIAAAPSTPSRRTAPGPIVIQRPNVPPTATPEHLRGFSPLEEARTPINQHVLSVLAEAPLPRLPAEVGQTAASGMPSLGASSHLLNANAVGAGNNHSAQDLSSRNSDDGGYQTPGEGENEGENDADGEGVFGPLRGAGSSSSRRQPALSPNGQQNSSPRGSPTTAQGDGEGDLQDSSAEGSAESDEARSSRLAAADASSRGSANRKGKTRTASSKRAAYSSSIDQTSGSGSAGGTNATGGKVKMFLKKAAGAGN